MKTRLRSRLGENTLDQVTCICIEGPDRLSNEGLEAIVNHWKDQKLWRIAVYMYNIVCSVCFMHCSRVLVTQGRVVYNNSNMRNPTIKNSACCHPVYTCIHVYTFTALVSLLSSLHPLKVLCSFHCFFHLICPCIGLVQKKDKILVPIKLALRHRRRWKNGV